MRKTVFAALMIAFFFTAEGEAAQPAPRGSFEEVIRVAPLGPQARRTPVWRNVAIGVTGVASPAASAPAIAFSVRPTVITAGEKATLNWGTENATSVHIDPGIGPVLASGSQDIFPGSTTEYTLTAEGPGGRATATATVTVNLPPPSITFSASPPAVTEGESSTLTWSTSFADTVIIDNDVGPVSSSGLRRVTPARTTKYTLTASGAGGESRSETTITVNPRAEKPDLVPAVTSVTPSRLVAGEQASVVVTVTNQGSALAGGSTARILLSSNTIFDPADVVLGSQPVPPLAVRASATLVVPVTIPAGTPSGQLFILVEADSAAMVDESDETNNTGYNGVTVDSQRQPASIVVENLPRGMVQAADSAGGVDSYTLRNDGQSPTTITLTQSAAFFQQSPVSFTLVPSQSQVIAITALARPAGLFDGFSVPSGGGVPANLQIPIRLLSSRPPEAPPRIVPVNARIETVAPADQNPTAQVTYRNIGGSQFEGIAVSDVSWIVPANEILRISPGEEKNLTITIVRANRPDGDAPVGGVLGTLSLRFLASQGTGLLRQSVDDEGGTGDDVDVFDVVLATPKLQNVPLLPPGQIAYFLPGLSGADNAPIIDLLIGNRRAAASREVSLYLSTPSSTRLVTPSVPGNSVVAFPRVARNTFGADVRGGSLQIRGGGEEDIAVLSVQLVTVGSARRPVHVPMLRSDLGVTTGKRIVLAGVGRTAQNSATIYVQEVGGFSGEVRLELLDTAGRTLGTRSHSISPFSFVEITDVPPGTATARIENASNGQARLGAYALVNDSAAGGVFIVTDIVRASEPPADSHVIPIVPARNGSLTGEIFVSNNTDASVGLLVETVAAAASSPRRRIVPRSSENDASLRMSNSETATLSIEARKTARVEVKVSAPSYLILRAPAESISASGRIAMVSAGATSPRTSMISAPVTRSLAYGEQRRFVGVDDASALSVERRASGTSLTSLLLIETANQTATVRVGLSYTYAAGLKASADSFISKNFEVSPGQMLVIADLARAVLGSEQRDKLPDLRGMQVEVEVVSGSGRVAPFVQSVDNGTGNVVIRGE
ncbi:MAG TPA: CARDB domain-containing protein [Thermoanaerobaculia bacterium]|nr:CARDB domain-containing protein [Thermoanaerobaculia bacterium]